MVDKKEKNLVYPIGEPKKYPVEEVTEPKSILVKKSIASIPDNEIMGIDLDKALEREIRKHQFMQSDISPEEIKKNFPNEFREKAAIKRAQLINDQAQPKSLEDYIPKPLRFEPEKIYHDKTGMSDVWETEAPKVSDFSMNPDWSEIQKQRALKNSLNEYDAFGNLGMRYPTYPDVEFMDPRHPDYDRPFIEESMKPGGYNTLHPAEDIGEYEKYWKDVNKRDYSYSKGDVNPTYAEWRAAKKFELGTPSEPVIPSLLQLAAIMGIQKALEIPEAGKDSDEIPQDEILDRRFKKLKSVLENK